MIGAKCVKMLIRFILTNGLWRVMFEVMEIICIYTCVFQKYMYIIDNLDGMLYLIVGLH